MIWAIEAVVGGVVAVIASVALVVRNFEAIAKAWNSWIAEPAAKRRNHREDEKHKPIVARIEALESHSNERLGIHSEALDEIKDLIQAQNNEIKRNLVKDRQISRATAMAVVSLYQDIQLRGKPNGTSSVDVQTLRNLIYQPDVSEDER